MMRCPPEVGALQNSCCEICLTASITDIRLENRRTWVMGLDASVMCNCYREGKTTPCPYPEHFELDEEGFPRLNMPYEGNEDKFDTFEEWLVDCCAHPHMDYAAVFVANWKGYRSFLQAL